MPNRRDTVTSDQEKSCAQCETVFKKNQKSLGCAVCGYWFCIDCSHISPKLYELLKVESTPNLPFNCDGCIRVLPKLHELGKHIDAQNKKFDEIDIKLNTIETTLDKKVEMKVQNVVEAYRDREERKLNLIVHNVPEPNSDSIDKKGDDASALTDIFATLQCNPSIQSFVRLGKPLSTKPRLLKVTLKNISDKHTVLGATKKLRSKNTEGHVTHKWGNIYITPDLSKDERDRNFDLRNELEKKKKSNPNLVIFRGKIVDKREINKTVKSASSPSGASGSGGIGSSADQTFHN